MPTCFIAMPISTPNAALYGGDADHFRHVLEHLLIPAIEEAGLHPIPPLAQGADVIHARIIEQLEKADLVLCDISGLNANVFFELGIRTALDRPICLVRDKLTPKIPFDTTLINHHPYSEVLDPWILKEEIPALSAHIKKSLDLSSGRNGLWHHFGLTIPGKPAAGDGDVGEKVGLLAQQVQILAERMAAINPEIPKMDVLRYLRALLHDMRLNHRASLIVRGDTIEMDSVTADGDISMPSQRVLGEAAAKYGYRLEFVPAK